MSRVLYHIGKTPPSPQPRRYGGAWSRPWMEKPIQKCVFLTPNPGEVFHHDETPGNCYAYRVPESIIDESGGTHRWKGIVSEVLIRANLWDEVEFLGKVSEHKYERFKRGVWFSRRREHLSPRGVSCSFFKQDDQSALTRNWKGLLNTKHPETAIKLLTDREIKGILSTLDALEQDILTQRDPESPEYYRTEIKVWAEEKMERRIRAIRKGFSHKNEPDISDPNFFTIMENKKEGWIARRAIRRASELQESLESLRKVRERIFCYRS